MARRLEAARQSSLRWPLAAAFAVIALGIAFELLRLATGIGGSAWSSLADNWVYMAIEFVAIGVCAARAASRREHRSRGC